MLTEGGLSKESSEVVMSLALWRKSQMNLSMKQIQAHIENRQVAAKERGRDGAEDWLLADTNYYT